MIDDNVKNTVLVLVNHNRRELARSLILAIRDSVGIEFMDQTDFEMMDKLDAYAELLGDRTIARLDKEALEAFTERMVADRNYAHGARDPAQVEIDWSKVKGEPEVQVETKLTQSATLKLPVQEPQANRRVEAIRRMPSILDEVPRVHAARQPVGLGEGWGGPGEPDTQLVEDDDPVNQSLDEVGDAPPIVLNMQEPPPDYTMLAETKRLDDEVNQSIAVPVGRPEGKDFN